MGLKFLYVFLLLFLSSIILFIVAIAYVYSLMALMGYRAFLHVKSHVQLCFDNSTHVHDTRACRESLLS